MRTEQLCTSALTAHYHKKIEIMNDDFSTSPNDRFPLGSDWRRGYSARDRRMYGDYIEAQEAQDAAMTEHSGLDALDGDDAKKEGL